MTFVVMLISPNSRPAPSAPRPIAGTTTFDRYAGLFMGWPERPGGRRFARSPRPTRSRTRRPRRGARRPRSRPARRPRRCRPAWRASLRRPGKTGPVQLEHTTIAGRYAVHEALGSGGMATVYRATDDVLGRDVAVKVLRPGAADDEALVARFRREARAAAGLAHL